MPFRVPLLVSVAFLLALAGPAAALTGQEINEAQFVADAGGPAAPAGPPPTESKGAKDKSTKAKAAKPDAGKKKTAAKPDPLIVKTQVLLARRAISPGVIDGMDGDNYRKALAQFRRQNGLGQSDTLDAATWQALGGAEARDIVMEYEVTKADAKTKFARTIPKDYAKQAKMKRLSYTSAREMFAERFHMDEELVAALNPKTKLDEAGARISVVSVARKPPEGKVERIEAVKETGMLLVYGPGEKILASYPATIGSDETRLEFGEYEIKRIARNPTYHYDPEKNFQQGRNTEKLVLPAGPNNPVGTVWIALSEPTFGIHGTPEPDKVSKTASHGCVRLTNWDVEELAGLVKPGMKLRFIEKPTT